MLSVQLLEPCCLLHFGFYFEKLVDINMDSVGYSEAPVYTNNDVLVRARKRDKQVQNTYIQKIAESGEKKHLKSVVSDESQPLVTRNF